MLIVIEKLIIIFLFSITIGIRGSSSSEETVVPLRLPHTFTYEAQTPQKIVTGCRGTLFPESKETHQIFYIIDATGIIKYVEPSSTIHVIFPFNTLLNSKIIQPHKRQMIRFTEICFPSQCNAPSCGNTVGPLTSYADLTTKPGYGLLNVEEFSQISEQVSPSTSTPCNHTDISTGTIIATASASGSASSTSTGANATSTTNVSITQQKPLSQSGDKAQIITTVTTGIPLVTTNTAPTSVNKKPAISSNSPMISTPQTLKPVTTVEVTQESAKFEIKPKPDQSLSTPTPSTLQSSGTTMTTGTSITHQQQKPTTNPQVEPLTTVLTTENEASCPTTCSCSSNSQPQLSPFATTNTLTSSGSVSSWSTPVNWPIWLPWYVQNSKVHINKDENLMEKDKSPITRDVSYYASLPGAIRGSTHVIYYPSCESDAYYQPAIVNYCGYPMSNEYMNNFAKVYGKVTQKLINSEESK